VSVSLIAVGFAGICLASTGDATYTPETTGSSIILFDPPNGPNGTGDPGAAHGTSAPQSGDGIPDGPGWP
jgi:hypothetical protein